MKYFDCPICGKKKAISQTDLETVTTPGSGKKRVGNYSRHFVGGEYDFSHAGKCPKLLYVFDKKALIEYHFFKGEPRIMKSDDLDFEDYQNALLGGGFEITTEVIRVDSPVAVKPSPVMIWKIRMFIHSRIASKEHRYLITEAITPQEAFDKLRHRLLCGEVITHIKPGMQIVVLAELPRLVSVEKK